MLTRIWMMRHLAELIAFASAGLTATLHVWSAYGAMRTSQRLKETENTLRDLRVKVEFMEDLVKRRD